MVVLPAKAGTAKAAAAKAAAVKIGANLRMTAISSPECSLTLSNQ
jgi:hypothetical protein